MNLKVYNTLTKQKEQFIPLVPGKVKMYVCGVTPYNHPHIGNARPYITWDVIKRYLKSLGFTVTHVQNFTDVDDKIINTGNAEGTNWEVISNRYIAAFYEVMDQLNILRADIYPRVSEHMQELIEMVEKLVEQKKAYELNGDVYFRVNSFAEYGKLSGRSLEDMQAGTRIDVNESKEHPMDFALWKSAKPNEPSWDSPWGKGRPGWHIECSAMSLKYLGESFDFHGGGSDLIFPHHENEVAQSESYSGKAPFVRYWLHNGFITVNAEKMSKSLGNFFLVKDILAHYSPDVLRYFIISTHYRSPIDFSDARLEEARRGLERLRNAVEKLLHLEKIEDGNSSEFSKALSTAAEQADNEFYQAMDDDFNTALAVSVLFGLAKEINVFYNLVMSGQAANAYAVVQQAKGVFYKIADILGMVVTERTGNTSNNDSLLGEVIDIIIEIRQDARKRKDWAATDQIRDSLGSIGIILEDSPQGVRWRRK